MQNSWQGYGFVYFNVKLNLATKIPGRTVAWWQCSHSYTVQAQVHKLPKKVASHLRIVGARRDLKKLHAEDPENLCCTVKNCVARDLWTPVYNDSCIGAVGYAGCRLCDFALGFLTTGRVSGSIVRQGQHGTDRHLIVPAKINNCVL